MARGGLITLGVVAGIAAVFGVIVWHARKRW